MFAVPCKPWVVDHHLILLHHTLQWESKNVATPDPSKLIKLAIAESVKMGRKCQKFLTSWLQECGWNPCEKILQN
jgi:hypothetical protein